MSVARVILAGIVAGGILLADGARPALDAMHFILVVRLSY